jgi:hypothetical protein
LRRAAVAIFAAALVSCAGQGSASTSPAVSPPVQSQAADLRTHLDLLLGEQVMIVAKESAAAVNHSDQYAPYTTLLSTNSADLTSIIGRAFGNTSAAQFEQTWKIQNGYLVDYAIGVVTHNDAQANGAMSGLTNGFVPQFVQVVSAMSGLPTDQVKRLAVQQVTDDKAFIDDVFAGSYSTYYQHLYRAYAQTAQLGDALATQIALKFPDKFPGDAFTQAAESRVSLNVLLQEHSYLATMATDATVAGRTQEASAASGALAGNESSLAVVFAKALGAGAGQRFTEIWTVKDTGLMGYAAGQSSQDNPVLTGKFVNDFVALSHANKTAVMEQLTATIRVIDDQRSKSSKTVANDDRAAATSMQPIADSIQG